MQLAIVAGGKGTRLGLESIPKPMIEINGRPLLEHQILLAKRYGITEIFILSGYLGHIIADYFGGGSKWGVKIHHITEPQALGTAGAVGMLRDIVSERFMVFYGDLVMDFNLNSFIRFDEQFDSLGTIIVHPNDHPFDSDLLEIDADNKIIGFYPKNERSEAWRRNLVNAAVYIFSPRIFKYIPDTFSDFGSDVFPQVLQSCEAIKAYQTSEYIKDMGTRERFLQTAADFSSGKVLRLNRENRRPAVFLDRDGTLNKNMDTQPSADNFFLLPETASALKKLNKSEFLSVVVTNQPMIAKGFVSFSEVLLIHKKMETLLGKEGAFIDRIYFCPHHPEKGHDGEISELKIPCFCRKPNPGMLFRARDELNVDLAASWMVGDSNADIQAGRAAGCKTVFLGESHPLADYCCSNAAQAVDFILERSK